MKQLNTLDEVMLAFLDYSPPGMTGQYKLERIIELLRLLGDPQNKIKVIHVAGTSGKTSTSYFIRGMLQATGKRTGLIVSPHITSINERVQVNGEPLPQAAFLAYVNRFMKIISISALQPTYFELLIGLAYWVFAEEKVDYAVVETGLGGRLDATNTVSRPDKVCVISDIGLDHVGILGNTIAEIAAQKAGIIQPYNHVITQNQDEDVFHVIKQTALSKEATLQVVGEEKAPELLPDFQRRNWSLASAVYQYLKVRDNLTNLTSQDIEKVTHQTPPGRWEIYRYRGKDIILDGAHNPQKMQAFCDALSAKNITKCAVLANFSEAPTEKINKMLGLIKPFSNHLIIPEFRAGQDQRLRRSLSAEQLQTYARTQGYNSVEKQPDPSLALEALINRPEDTLIITGSLYLVSAIRPLLENYCSKS